jgi:hypothetical protein
MGRDGCTSCSWGIADSAASLKSTLWNNGALSRTVVAMSRFMEEAGTGPSVDIGLSVGFGETPTAKT